MGIIVDYLNIPIKSEDKASRNRIFNIKNLTLARRKTHVYSYV